MSRKSKSRRPGAAVALQHRQPLQQERREPQAHASTHRWVFRLLPVLIALVTFVPFLPTLDNQFVNWDDDDNLVENPHYRGLGWTHLRWMWTTSHIGHYAPLTWMTFGLDYLLWGMNPVGYHLTNLLLHAANAAVFYLVACRILGLALPGPAQRGNVGLAASAAFAALLFAIHPLRVESVAWATERRDVLSGLFYLLTLLVYLRAGEQGERGRSGYWASVGLFVCALLSKSMAMSLPVVLLILDVYPLRRLGGARGWWGEPARRIYLAKIPFVLPGLPAAWLAYVVILLPVLGIFQNGPQIAADRYTYLAGLGWALLASAGMLAAWRRRSFLVTGLAVVLLLGFGTLTWNQVRVWHDSEKLWSHAVAIDPGSSIGQLSLGLALARHGKLAEAVEHYEAALRLEPGYVDANASGGPALARQGKLAEAVAHYEPALRTKPDHADAHSNMGAALVGQGKLAEAIEHYQQALRAKPDHADAHTNLGEALAQQGKLDEAIEHYRRALEIRPESADAHNDWGLALARQGKLAEAVKHYQEAVKLRPSFTEAQSNLVNALRTLGMGPADTASSQKNKTVE